MPSMHKVPIHLDIEDTFVFGLTLRQCLIVGMAAALGWSVFNEVSFALPFQFGAQVLAAFAGLVVACGIGCAAFLRISGRPIEQWAFVGLLYLSAPKLYRWTYNRDVVVEDGEDVEVGGAHEFREEKEVEGW